MDQKILITDISIHAPVKGATQLGLTIHIAILISIHAPVKGATTYNKHIKHIF